MTTRQTPKPLKYGSNIISYPYLNLNDDGESINSILVDIDDGTSNVETVSLRYSFAAFYPKYRAYLHKNRKYPLNLLIVDYVDRNIESTILFKYEIGQFGYISTAESLEKSFGFITEKTEYDTEIYFLHEDLQKYKFQHCDITSTTFKTFTDEEIDGEAHGWIVESIFTPIESTIIAATATEHLLNWKICREYYLQRQIILVKMELNKQIEDRGILFRDTVDQWLFPVVKSLRGKITPNNVGKTVEIAFNTPPNCWDYYLEPTISDIFDVADDEELNTDGNWTVVDLNLLELSQLINKLYCIKFYDQHANTFKLNQQIKYEIEHKDDVESVQQHLVDNLNKYSEKRYKKLKENSNKILTLKKVKYFITIDGLEWRHNKNTNKSKWIVNVYKVLLLRSGGKWITGKIY